MEYNKIDKALGTALFEARVVKRITQEDMVSVISKRYKELSGKKNGISRQMYSYYEKGMYSMPMDIFQIACEYLNLNWQEVFNDALENCKEKI